MEQKINIVSLLESCPKGTKLYSPIFDKDKEYNCSLLEVADEHNIKINSLKEQFPWVFDEQGTVSDGGECLLFPSKEVRDWRYFNTLYFKEYKSITPEDIQKAKQLFYNQGVQKQSKDDYLCIREDTIWYVDRWTNTIESIDECCQPTFDYILTTGKELKLEDEEPAFRAGDVVTDGLNIVMVVDKPMDDLISGDFCIDVKGVNTFEPLYSLVTSKRISSWNKEVLHPNHLHYSESKRKIIDWFLTKDEVVGRVSFKHKWTYSIFSHYEKDRKKPYITIGLNPFEQCLPYNEETKHLIGTTDDWQGEL